MNNDNKESTDKNEKMIVILRQHWIILFLSLFFSSLISFFFITLAFFVFKVIHPSYTLLISTIITAMTITSSLIAKSIVDWYCHLYIVTNQKILEVCSSPLFSDEINEVILDQVRCTEVDVKTNGIINELLDKGNVVVTFDRPTHQEEFVFKDIENPQELGVFLGNSLDWIKNDGKERVWYHPKNKHNIFRFTEEIFPKARIGEI